MTRHALAQRLFDAHNRSIGRDPFDIDRLPYAYREAWLRKAEERLPAPRRVIFDFLTEYFSRPQRGGGGAFDPSFPGAPPTQCSGTAMTPSMNAAREAGLSPCSVSQPVSSFLHDEPNGRESA